MAEQNKFQIPQSLKRTFEAGKLRRNLPTLMKTNCAADGRVVSLDGQNKYEELEFIPLRVDYTRSAYDGRELGLLLAVVVGGTEINLSAPRNNRRQLPQGMNFYLCVNRNKSGTGPLDNFEQMSIQLEQITGTLPQGWVWTPRFEAKTGMIVEGGIPKPIAYARCFWMVRQIEAEIEAKFMQEIGDIIENDPIFEAICPVQNKALAKFDELALMAQIQAEQKALPEA